MKMLQLLVVGYLSNLAEFNYMRRVYLCLYIDYEQFIQLKDVQLVVNNNIPM